MREWEKLPPGMQKPEVRPYYDILIRKKAALKAKRTFDVLMASFLLLVFAIPMFVIAILIKLDSPGPVFYRQERVTQYCRIFRIHKFRTMVADADRIGSAVTVDQDNRITKIGLFLRKYRLDELPQLIDVLQGNMSFVGTRPEAVKYVRKYTPEMRATLLLPAGITSKASILYKDEAKLLQDAENVDEIYLKQVLPDKMKYNLESLERFSVWGDFMVMADTAATIFKSK